MRCSNCPYEHSPQYEDDEEYCEIFGYGDDVISENSKGECGCRYNRIQLKRMYDKEVEIREKAILNEMSGFFEFMKTKKENG